MNASNFVFMKMKYQKKQPAKLIQTDRVFLHELNNLIELATEAFEEYNYSKALAETQNFFWKNFTDNYIEIVKDRIYNGTDEEKASASYTLYQSLLTILKLMAPFTPYITEEIYQEKFKQFEKTESIHISDWPKPISIALHKNDDKICST